MPQPDSPASVITVSSGNKKTNESWVIGRLIRDLERDVRKHFRTWKEFDMFGELVESGSGDSGLLVTCYEVRLYILLGMYWEIVDAGDCEGTGRRGSAETGFVVGFVFSDHSYTTCHCICAYYCSSKLVDTLDDCYRDMSGACDRFAA